MDRTAWPSVLLMLLAVFISSASQAMLKRSALKTYKNRWLEYINPWVIAAYALYFGTTLLCAAAYWGLPLSVGTALQSSGYVFVTVFGILFFGEKLGLRRLLALVLIVAGILIYTLCG